MPAIRERLDAGKYQLKDQVVAINRVTKVVKGGKNLSFAALVVVGDPSAGVVGHGSGKAKEVPQAIRKGIEAAKKNLMRVHLTQNTIPHVVLGRFGAGRVLLKPAPEGTGVIAGGAVRAVMTSAGVQNVLTKSLGSANPHNVVKATFAALMQLRDRRLVAAMRGKTIEEMKGLPRKQPNRRWARCAFSGSGPPSRLPRSTSGWCAGWVLPDSTRWWSAKTRPPSAAW